MDEETLRDFAGRLAEAERRADVALLAGLVSEQFVGVDASGALFDREELLARFGQVQFSRHSVQEMHVAVRGSVGVIAGVVTLEGTLGDAAFSGVFRFHDVCLAERGAWRLIAAYSAPLEAGGAR